MSKHVYQFGNGVADGDGTMKDIEALRREIGPKGVRVTVIEPGLVASEFQRVAD